MCTSVVATPKAEAKASYSTCNKSPHTRVRFLFDLKNIYVFNPLLTELFSHKQPHW